MCGSASRFIINLKKFVQTGSNLFSNSSVVPTLALSDSYILSATTELHKIEIVTNRRYPGPVCSYDSENGDRMVQ
jgi:hypothetical protein